MSIETISGATRRPMAEANWKMAMTVAESLAFLQAFRHLAGSSLDKVDVLLCPPFTAIWAMAQALQGASIELGAQNLASVDDLAHTGQISAALALEAGCRWAVVGHWEVRRDLGDQAESLNRKVNLALAVGLRPLLMIGESHPEKEAQSGEIADQLEQMLRGCSEAQVFKMAFIYEPVWAIGAPAPASPEHAARGCELIRLWLYRNYGDPVGRAVRILYGGSVSPEHAPALLTSADIDGFGVGRQGRHAGSFAEIVNQIAAAKSP